MNDPVWCRSRLDNFEKDLERLGQSGRHFAEFLDEVQTTWSDRAAVELFQRYLVPHCAELTETRKRLRFQLAQLCEVVARMCDAEPPAAEILSLSDDAIRRRQRAEGELKSAHHRADRSFGETSDAQHRTKESIRVLESI